MKVAVIYGSNRSERQGIKAAKFIINKLKEADIEVDFIDSKKYQLPLLDKMHKEYEEGKAPEPLEQIHKILNSSDGFVIVSGEYNHSIPAALKNILDHFQQEFYFKPSAIVSYSAGPFGGMRVAVHLRAVLAELGMPSIPSIFPISAVQSSIDDNGSVISGNYDKYVVRFIDEFKWYLRALNIERKNGVPY
jgi:NAD(P)H-dependent FMN reductase